MPWDEPAEKRKSWNLRVSDLNVQPVMLSPKIRRNAFLHLTPRQILKLQGLKLQASSFEEGCFDLRRQRTCRFVFIITDRHPDRRRSSSLRAPNAPGSTFGLAALRTGLFGKVIEIQGASLQSCTCPYGSDKSIIEKYNAKEVAIQGHREAGRDDGSGGTSELLEKGRASSGNLYPAVVQLISHNVSSYRETGTNMQNPSPRWSCVSVTSFQSTSIYHWYRDPSSGQIRMHATLTITLQSVSFKSPRTWRAISRAWG